MKRLLIFLAGFVTGVIAVTLYELFGVPAMPEDYHEWSEGELEYINRTMPIPDNGGVIDCFSSNEMDETQPIYIGESDDTITGYELYIWSGESE